MFRKCFAAVVATMLVVGGLFAEEIKGVFKKFEDNKLTIADADGKETTYKVDPEAKFTIKFGKDGTEKEVTTSDVLSSPRMKEGRKLTITVEKDLVTKVVPERKNFKKTDDKKTEEKKPDDKKPAVQKDN